VGLRADAAFQFLKLMKHSLYWRSGLHASHAKAISQLDQNRKVPQV
jgi:hypothetical protein